jgi:hypothetical protein
VSERRSDHLSEEQLALYQDGALPASEASHLEACAACSGRLRDLAVAGAAYREYLTSIQAAAPPSPPRPWHSLDSLIAEHEAARSRHAWRWWMVPALGAAVCVGVVIGLLVRRPGPAPSIPANELLARSAAMELPVNRSIALRVHGRSVVRPAVLLSSSTERDPDLTHLAMLFDEARYSWREPLSARSFEDWRAGLREKRDSVTVVHSGDPERAYRVRTETATGVLRSATLTLRAKDLRPTQGAFEFQGEQPVEIEEAGAAPPPETSQLRTVEPKLEPKAVAAYTPASPEDTLHVLAALNEIGADVGEPIEIAEDAQHQVLVRASGLTPERARQVAAVLESLPHVKMVLSAGNGSPLSARPTLTERSSTGMPRTLRQKFEDSLGGAVALQEVTDRVLEASGLAVAQAHALEVLATKFPPQTEAGLAEADSGLLRRLRQGHLMALDDLTARIAAGLEAILPAPGPPGATRPPELMAAVQQADDSLNRLLAGSYSESSGEALLNGLAVQLRNLRQTIELQKERGR